MTEGRFLVGLIGILAAALCPYCDFSPHRSSSAMWMELEQLEAGSQVARAFGVTEHELGLHYGTNCRCPMFPQPDNPDNLA
jgi:hypothetical protein